MYARIFSAAAAYAKEIGLDPTFSNYCYTDLNMRTNAQPKDGAIPFGFNYNNVPDQKTLDQVISVRENYERSFIILCMANAKKVLNDARNSR